MGQQRIRAELPKLVAGLPVPWQTGLWTVRATRRCT